MKPPAGATSVPARQGPDWWFPWLVGGFTAVSVAVWAGASLAVLVTVGDRYPRLVDAGTALLRLPGTAGSPAAAWPDPIASGLPGAAVYWLCQAVVLAVFGGLAAAAVKAWRAVEHRPGPMGEGSDGGFARRRHLKRLVVREPVPGRVTIGRCNGRLLACEEQASLAVFGPSGCGKTMGFAVPALLEWKGPVIATTVKGDILDATIAHRRRRGRVWVYDPERSTSHGFSSPWSPLPGCQDWSAAIRLADAMVSAARPSKDNVENADYWYSQAAKGLAPYLHAAAIDGRGLADVIRWVDTQNRTQVEKILRADQKPSRALADAAIEADEALRDRWDEIHADLVERMRRMVALAPDDRAEIASLPFDRWPGDLTDDLARMTEEEWQAEVATAAGDPGAPLAAAMALWKKDERLKGSVYASIEVVLRSWAEPSVGALSRPSEGAVDLDTWLAGDNTIFVVATSHDQDRLRPVFTVLMQQAIRRAYETAGRTRAGRLERPCLILLDEAGNITPLPDLPAYVSTARSHGITLVTVWQDHAQVTATYGDRARTILNNHRAKLYGSGLGDETALDYVSRLVGEQVEVQRNVSTDLHGGRRSISEHHAYRRAAPADAVRRLPPGRAVLLYGAEPPAHVQLRPWFDDRRLRRLAEPFTPDQGG